MLNTPLELLGVLVLFANTYLAALLGLYVAQAYRVGMFRRTAVGYISTATNAWLRSAPRERTVEELGRYQQLRLLQGEIASERSSPRSYDRAIAAILGDPGDEDVLARLASRRRELHREALWRLEARACGAGAERILEDGPRWLRAETRRLVWHAAHELLPAAGHAFVERARRAVPDATLIVGVLTLMGWPLLAYGQLRLVTLAELMTHAGPLAVGLGLVTGIGWVLIDMHRGALRSVVDAMSETEAVSFRRLLFASFAVAAVTFVVYYYGWPHAVEQWSDSETGHINGWWSFVIVAVIANYVLARGLHFAWAIWRAEGIVVRWQRLEYLGAALFVGAMLFAFDVLGPLALSRIGDGHLWLAAEVVVVSLATVGCALSGRSRTLRAEPH